MVAQSRGEGSGGSACKGPTAYDAVRYYTGRAPGSHWRQFAFEPAAQFTAKMELHEA